jgi:hypothetical protein
MFLAGAMLGLSGPASAGPTEPLSSLAAGDTVSFAGYTWIVLDNGAASGSSYLLMQEALKDSGGNYLNMAFDSNLVPSFKNSTSISGYLNSTFLGSLPKAAQALIQEHAWGAGGIDTHGSGSGSSATVSDYIGLISYSDCHTTYSKYVSNLTDVNGWWTLTPVSGSPGGVWFVGPNVSLDYVDANDTFAGTTEALRPALYLSSATLVSGGNGGAVATSAD